MKKSKCLMKTPEKKIEVSGYEFQYQGCKLIVHKLQYWQVVEPITGRLIVPRSMAKSRKQAIMEAKKAIDKACKVLGMNLSQIIYNHPDNKGQYESMPSSIRQAYTQGYQPK